MPSVRRSHRRVIVAREVETSFNRNERLRRQRRTAEDEGAKLCAIAEGIGIRFNLVSEGWIVAALSRFGRANLSGNPQSLHLLRF
jgi:hypothetical protein